MCFEDEEVITVGSSAYNLAGDVESRGNFMKNNILSMIFSGTSKNGMGAGIVDAHLAGPATAYNRFFKWAETSGYNDQVGNLNGLIYNTSSISLEGFRFLVPVKTAPILPVPETPPLLKITHDQRAITSSITALDLNLIALEWIINNNPTKRYDSFKATLERVTNVFTGKVVFTGKIVITYAIGDAISFTPEYDLNSSMPFLCLYHEERIKFSEKITETDWLEDTPPDTTDFTKESSTEVIEGNVDKTITTVTSYSDGRPSTSSVTTEPVFLSFDKITDTYTQITTVDATPITKGKETTIVQIEESFYSIEHSSEVTSSTEEISSSTTTIQTAAVSFSFAANKKINSAGVVVTDATSNTTLAIPIYSDETLVASHSPVVNGYNGLVSASGVIPSSLTTGTSIPYTSGATQAYFSYPSDATGFGITRYYPVIVVTTVTATTTVTTVTPYVESHLKYQRKTTVVTQEKWQPYLLKIYQKGSSVEGDALLFNLPTQTQKFFPVIPLRRDNVMVDLTNFPTQYAWNRKAAKKCFGTKQKYDSLIESLTDNPDLESIDHAWVVFGVSLSTKQQDGQKYLFNFFRNLADTTFGYTNAYKSPTAYENAWVDFLAAVAESTNDEESGIGRPIPPISQDYTITINSLSGVQNWLYNTTITAKGGGQVFGSGYHAKSSGKVGNCWVYTKHTVTTNIPVSVSAGGTDGDMMFTYPATSTVVIAFGKQLTSGSWVEYEFFDLAHVNNVYQGISTTTLGTTVMSNPSENSSFIIPIHEGVFKEMTLIRRTQFSLESSFLVVNYYDKQVIPWYASSFFQIVLVIVVIIVAVSTGYISSETLGVLGANGMVGGALGLTGLAATVAGAIANSVAAAIISSMILKVAVSALGEDVGKIIGFIASVYAMNWMSSDGAFNIADTWVEFTKAENLVKLSMSGIQEYGSYLQGQAVEINAKTQAMMAESNEALKGINQLMQELLGDSGVNSSTITDALRYASETPAQFLDRTTMTGTEIAELSIKLVENFPAPQLKLPYTSE